MLAPRTLVLGAKILVDGQYMGTHTAQYRWFVVAMLRPASGLMVRDFIMTLPAGVIGAAAVHANRDHINEAKVMLAAGLLI